MRKPTTLYRTSVITTKCPDCQKRCKLLLVMFPDENGVWIVQSTQYFCNTKNCRGGVR